MGGAPVARLARVPRVVGHLQELWSKRDSSLIGPLARATHQLVTVSSPVRENLVPSLRRRAVVVPNATPDPETVTPLEGREGPLTFVIASRWVGGKGHDTLLAAWDKASSPGRLIILGGEPPTGDAVDVVRLVESSNRPETVRSRVRSLTLTPTSTGRTSYSFRPRSRKVSAWSRSRVSPAHVLHW